MRVCPRRVHRVRRRVITDKDRMDSRFPLVHPVPLVRPLPSVGGPGRWLVLRIPMALVVPVSVGVVPRDCSDHRATSEKEKAMA